MSGNWVMYMPDRLIYIEDLPQDIGLLSELCVSMYNLMLKHCSFSLSSAILWTDSPEST